MPALIEQLIDKVDTVELVRDQIGAILLVESQNQQLLAASAGKDFDLWDLRVFTGAHNPWAPSSASADPALPIVNVLRNTESFDKSKSDIVKQQHDDATFHIDCYGFGISSETDDGHSPGDVLAEDETARAVRLVRNILMSAHYTYLGLPRGTVGTRWTQGITFFEPEFDARPVQHVIGARLSFEVSFNEYSPQHPGTPLEEIGFSFFRKSDGQLLLAADYDFTP